MTVRVAVRCICKHAHLLHVLHIFCRAARVRAEAQRRQEDAAERAAAAARKAQEEVEQRQKDAEKEIDAMLEEMKRKIGK